MSTTANTRTAARRAMRNMTEGSDTFVFAGPDGSLWWTDKYALAPIPTALLSEVESGHAYRFLVGGIQAPKATSPEVAADMATGLIPKTVARLQEDTFTTVKHRSGYPVTDLQGGPVVYLQRANDEQYTHVAERYRPLLNGDMYQQAEYRPGSRVYLAPIIVRKPDGTLAAIVMPTKTKEVVQL